MSTIEKTILNRIRAGTCAIGFFLRDPEQVLRDVRHADFEIAGTGFLVDLVTVITNAHVVNDLRKLRKRRPSAWEFLQFTYFREGGWHVAFQRIAGKGEVEGDVLDIAFLEFQRRSEDEFDACQPLQFGDLASLNVSDVVAACGYPHGERLLKRRDEWSRFGPVIQQGHISAISPYDVPGGRIDWLLLDVRMAPSMSGSPVFTPGDGGVVGMLTEGWVSQQVATTSVALALGDNEVSDLLAIFNKERGKSPPRA